MQPPDAQPAVLTTMPTEFDEQRHHRGRLLLESSPGLAWTTVALLLLCLLLLQSPLSTSASSDTASSAATAMLERMRAAAKAGSAASSTTAAGAGAGAAAAASTPESVQSVGSSYVIQALQRHNSSGTLPSVTTLNEMLRTVNGEGALQLNESFTTAAASPTSAASTGAFTNSVLGLNGNSAASYGVSSMPAGVASPFPSLSAVGSPGPLPGLSTTPAQLFALMDDAGGGFGLGGDGGGSFGAPSPEVEAGLRAIRFGMYDSLFGYLPFAGFQLLAIGNFILIKDEKTAFILFAVGNELIGLGFLFIGIKGTEATDVAVRALAVIIEEEATGNPPAAATGAAAPVASATALASPQGAGFTPQPPAPVPGPISSAPISSVPPPVGTGRSSTDPILGGLSAGLPFTSAAAHAQAATTAQTTPAATDSASSTTPYTFLAPTASATVTAASASSSSSRSAKTDATPLSCSSLLYGSWLRIETDAMGSGASPPKKAAAASASAAQQDESVLLRFSATSFERLERVRVGDKRRTRQQHWTGSLHVECEGESEGDDNDWASLGVPISASGSTLVTVSMTGTGAGALLSDDSTALFFTYLPVQLSGNTNGVLVERSEFDESPTAAAHRRAYIRI